MPGGAVDTAPPGRTSLDVATHELSSGRRDDSRHHAWRCLGLDSRTAGPAPAGLAAGHLQGPVQTVTNSGPPPFSGALQDSEGRGATEARWADGRYAASAKVRY